MMFSRKQTVQRCFIFTRLIRCDREPRMYPSFKLPVDERAFAHWVSRSSAGLVEQTSCSCELCGILTQRVHRCVKILVETLLTANKALVKESDITSLVLGRISYRCARACLDAADDEGSFKSLLVTEFPGLELDDLIVKNNFMFGPIIANGGHSLLSLVGRFYRNLTGSRPTPEDERIGGLPFYPRLRFLCLCFHFSQTYLMTADSSWQMWTDTLCSNSITSMLNIPTAARDSNSNPVFF